MEEKPKHSGGRPCEPVKEAWALRFGLCTFRQWRLLTPLLCWQLCQCRSDEARRLILGVGLKDDFQPQ